MVVHVTSGGFLRQLTVGESEFSVSHSVHMYISSHLYNSCKTSPQTSKCDSLGTLFLYC